MVYKLIVDVVLSLFRESVATQEIKQLNELRQYISSIYSFD